jgi:hypothetical protein
MIFISNKPGQLGNRLFVFANFIALGCEQNLSIVNPAFDEYCEYFESCASVILPGFPKGYMSFSSKPLRRFLYRLSYYTARFLHRSKINNSYVGYVYLNWGESFDLCSRYELLHKNMCFVQGWEYQAGTSLTKHKTIISNFFKPKTEYLDKINGFIQNLRLKNRRLIGIHIRQGDYKNFLNGKFYFQTGEYINLIRQITDLFVSQFKQKPIFIIFSNQQNAQEEFAQLTDTDCVFGLGHELLDMYSLAACDYIAGPPSTYSIWASYYGNVPLYMFRQPGDEIVLSDFKIRY